jgi:hypothetical protein
MIVRLARVAVLRNTLLEERIAGDKELSLRELRSLRHDVLHAIDDDDLRREVEARFARARFPFRHDRIVPRVTVSGTAEGEGLEPGFRSQPHWPEGTKRALVELGWRLTDDALRAIEPPRFGHEARMGEHESEQLSSDEPVESGALEERPENG